MTRSIQHLKIEAVVIEGRKTPVYNVFNTDGELLGVMRWHAPWRQYVWDDDSGVIMSKSCDLEKWHKLEELERKRKADVEGK